MNLRYRFDNAVDWLRFQVDRQRAYQPLPEIGVFRASRTAGMESRWAPMEELIEEFGPQSALDVGCNAGFFALQLAGAGVPVVGVDSDARFLRLFQRAADATSLPIGVLNLRVDPESCRLLPTVDMTVFLAVWHHNVRDFGIDGATHILRSLWERTQSVLIFESGEQEMGPEFQLPDFVPNPCEYLDTYLRTTCRGGVVRHLGRHQAAPYGTTVERNLFAVTRR